MTGMDIQFVKIDGLVSSEPLFPPPATKPDLRAQMRDGGSFLGKEEIVQRAQKALARDLPILKDLRCPSIEVAVIGGGPSINDHVSIIRRLKRNGVAIVSVNKSHDWLLENGIVPWAHILLDAKECVADYVKRPRRDVKYLIASQCHDAVFAEFEGYQVFVWHAGQDFEDGGSEPLNFLQTHYPRTPWCLLPGPTTVGLRAIPVLHLIGAVKFHLLGLDSSRGYQGKMHGYDKPDPLGSKPLPLSARYKGVKYRFDSNTHMARQYLDFAQMIDELPGHMASGRYRDGFKVTVYGAGLIPFYAATLGLHADPECNEDPTKVGGYYVDQPVDHFGIKVSDLIYPMQIAPIVLPIEFQ